MPRADDFPQFKLDTVCTPCTHNPLGTKGCGEAGAIGSPPAVINAVLDALKALGVKDLDMPASPAPRVGSHPGRASPERRRRSHVRIHLRTSRHRWPTPPAGRPPAAKPLAGGQTLLASMKLRLANPEQLVDLGGIAELAGIRARGQRAGDRRDDAPRRRRRQRRGARRRSRRWPTWPAHIGDRQVRAHGHARRLGGQQRPGRLLPGAVLALGRDRAHHASARSRPTTSSRACSPPRWRRAS